MDREKAREFLKENLREYVEKITEKSKGANMYNCPLCGSGTGHRGTGAFSLKDATTWHCFSCEKGGDIFDLIGELEHTTDYNEQLKLAAAEFNITIDHSTDYTSDMRSKLTQVSKAVTKSVQMEQSVDYTDFFLQANKDLVKTDYHRGISIETLNRFNIGYVEAWRHPKVSENVPTSPRLIIPTSKDSYLARDTRNTIPENQQGYVKSKVGSSQLFNVSALWEATQPIFIVEGELDALSIIDAGGEAVALGSTSNVKRLINEVEQRVPKQALIIALDNDIKGKEATEKLTEGLQKLNISCYKHDICKGYKDANELLNASREALTLAIEDAKAEADEELKAKREEELNELLSENAANHLEHFLQVIKNNSTTPAIPTGFTELDELLDGGLYAGLYFIGAISSLGKTTFCLQIADQIAATGTDVLIYSLEMAREELMAKSISRLTCIESLKWNNDTRLAKTTRGILKGGYRAEDKEIITKALSEYSKYAEHIHITVGIGNVGVSDIVKKVKHYKMLTGKAPVVIIDYLQILAPSDVRATDKQNTDRAVNELKIMSTTYGIPVIGISSFNRENYTSPVNKASFKESGAIEYSSDVLIGLQYNGMDYVKGEKDKERDGRIRQIFEDVDTDTRVGNPIKVQVKILKNRNGARGSCLLDYRTRFNYYYKGTVTTKGADADEW